LQPNHPESDRLLGRVIHRTGPRETKQILSKSNWHWTLIAAAAWLALQSGAHAQTRTVEDEQDLINWYYAATYGTGIYSAGDRTVGVLKIPLSRTLRASSDDQWGLRLLLPVTLGFYDFGLDSVVGDGLPDRIGTFSFVPGIEFEKRVVPRWLLKPYVTAGMGWELDGGGSAVIYDAGLRSRFRLGEHRETAFSLVNLLSLAGYNPSGGPNEPLGLFAIGVDIEAPFPGTLFGRPVVLSVLPVYYYYFSRLSFTEFVDPVNKLHEQAELAVSVLAKQPFKVLGINVDRFGVAIRYNADLQGFRLFTSLPF